MFASGLVWICWVTVIHLQESSGQPCPVKECLIGEADCVNNSCICRPPAQQHTDNGQFACYKSNQRFAEVVNDPTVRNFNDEKANFPFPCRYLLSSVSNQLKINKQIVGTCKCEVYVWNEKNLGKFLIGGLDYGCHVQNDNTSQSLDFSVRVQGFASNGSFQFSQDAISTYIPDGPWPDTNSPLNIDGAGIHVEPVIDAPNKRFVLWIKECGHRITFVAPDRTEGLNQAEIPGVSFAVNCALGPSFPNEGNVIATAPVSFGGQKYSTLAVGFPTVTDFLLYRAFNANVSQNQPNAAPECTTLKNNLVNCAPSDLDELFSLLEIPRFIRCSNPDPVPSIILQLVESSARYHCTNDTSCQDFQNKVIETGCQNTTGYPVLTAIVDENYCN